MRKIQLIDIIWVEDAMRKHGKGRLCMSLQLLKEQVYEANIKLWKSGLVVLTWGNVSGIDREQGLMAIKPSGVSYELLKPSDIVLVRLDNGQAVDSALRPSSDTPTHLKLYRAWPEIGGVTHTHSRMATAWAQAKMPIPCFGTTHADSFHGQVPCARPLTAEEVARDYEGETGNLIVETFKDIPRLHVPAVLLSCHGPFTWGETPDKAVENAIILEEVAAMAAMTRQISPDSLPCPEHVSEKHFQRKHGKNAYYGQKK